MNKLLKNLLMTGLLLPFLIMQPYAQQNNFDNVEITTNQVSENIYMLQGAGGNIGILVGDDGVFMIDDQFAPLTEKIIAAIKEVSELPVKYLINTHWHHDHTGGNENLGKQGVIIAAHNNVYKRLTTEQHMEAFDHIVAPLPKAAHPVITYGHDMTFNINGEQVVVNHISNAHTDGDSILHFKNANVIHTGDIFFSGAYPFIDYSSGGTISGNIKAVETILAMADDNTRIIPGHGPLSSKKDLQAYRKMLVTAKERIGKLKNQGKSLTDIQAAKPMADYDDSHGQGFINPDTFIMLIYKTLEK